MPFINYKFIHTVVIDESLTMTSEQVLYEKQVRQNDFRRALNMGNTISAVYTFNITVTLNI